jgi:hypothetical protein
MDDVKVKSSIEVTVSHCWRSGGLPAQRTWRQNSIAAHTAPPSRERANKLAALFTIPTAQSPRVKLLCEVRYLHPPTPFEVFPCLIRSFITKLITR